MKTFKTVLIIAKQSARKIIHNELRRIKWRHLFERKVLICLAFVGIAHLLGQHYHWVVISQTKGILVASIADHILFGVPVFEE